MTEYETLTYLQTRVDELELAAENFDSIIGKFTEFSGEWHEGAEAVIKLIRERAMLLRLLASGRLE